MRALFASVSRNQITVRRTPTHLTTRKSGPSFVRFPCSGRPASRSIGYRNLHVIITSVTTLAARATSSAKLPQHRSWRLIDSVDGPITARVRSHNVHTITCIMYYRPARIRLLSLRWPGDPCAPDSVRPRRPLETYGVRYADFCLIHSVGGGRGGGKYFSTCKFQFDRYINLGIYLFIFISNGHMPYLRIVKHFW